MGTVCHATPTPHLASAGPQSFLQPARMVIRVGQLVIKSSRCILGGSPHRQATGHTLSSLLSPTPFVLQDIVALFHAPPLDVPSLAVVFFHTHTFLTFPSSWPPMQTYHLPLFGTAVHMLADPRLGTCMLPHRVLYPAHLTFYRPARRVRTGPARHAVGFPHPVRTTASPAESTGHPMAGASRTTINSTRTLNGWDEQPWGDAGSIPPSCPFYEQKSGQGPGI